MPRGKFKIVTVEGSFHGRTYAAMTATAQTKYHAGFEPMVPGFTYIPHNDLDAAVAAVDDQTAALLIEPIQGEGGIRLPAPGYLAGLKEICEAKGVLLIFDEVQTGMGRTGEWFAHRLYDVEPDMITLRQGAGLGGRRRAHDRQGRVRPTAQAWNARLHFRRQSDRLPGRPGDHRDDRGRRAARSHQAGWRAVPNAVRVAPRAASEFRQGHSRRRRMIGARDRRSTPRGVVEACLKERASRQRHQRAMSFALLPAMNIDDDQIDLGCEVIGKAISRLASET